MLTYITYTILTTRCLRRHNLYYLCTFPVLNSTFLPNVLFRLHLHTLSARCKLSISTQFPLSDSPYLTRTLNSRTTHNQAFTHIHAISPSPHLETRWKTQLCEQRDSFLGSFYSASCSQLSQILTQLNIQMNVYGHFTSDLPSCQRVFRPYSVIRIETFVHIFAPSRITNVSLESAAWNANKKYGEESDIHEALQHVRTRVRRADMKV